jgi:hypothetical protein
MSKFDEKIAIIGGGPAGVMAAMYLEKKGYKGYTLFERDSHVGGKCYSPVYADTKDGANLRHYEMGAIMGCDTYYATLDAEKFGGTTHDGPKLLRTFRDKNGKIIEPFNPKKNLLKTPELLRMKHQVKKLGKLLKEKYYGYDVAGHRGVAEGRYEGIAPTGPDMPRIQGNNPNLKDLTLPFKEFLALNKIPLVSKLWIAPYTSFGYGYFDEIPAAYVLKYLDFHTTMEFLNLRLWSWHDGTQSIWEGVNRNLKHPALLNSEVSKVARKDGKVYVTVNGETKEFDKIIITTPLDQTLAYFDSSAEEKDLFGRIIHEEYSVLATRQEKGNTPTISSYIFDNMEPERLGHLMVYYHRWSDLRDQPIVTYALRNHKGSKEIPYETCKSSVLEDMKLCGSEVKDIEFEKDWYYFPHVSSEDYAAGWYEKVEALQGSNNTYYAGEAMSFGDMEETSEYSKDLIERFF